MQQRATSLTLFSSAIETDVVLVTILIVVDNENSYRDLLLDIRVLYSIYLLYESAIWIANASSDLQGSTSRYCSNTLLGVWSQQ